MSHSENYKEILKSRRDMTGWLLHFTHSKHLDDGSFGGCNVAPRDVLLEILDAGHLQPGWSIRGGRRSVYGPRPVVCFSEMTLSSFSEYLEARGEVPGVMSGYGVLIHKLQAFSAGAIPVIYDKVEDESFAEDGERKVDSVLLPYEQQFRLVRTNLYSGPAFSDWTHEREWRWPRGQGDGERVLSLTESRKGDGRRAAEGRPHVFVRYDRDIEEIQKEMCAKRDALPVDYVQRLSGSGIISLETVEREVRSCNWGYCRLEDWPADVDLLMARGRKSPAPEVFVHPIPTDQMSAVDGQ